MAPIESESRMLGHRSIRTIQVYAKGLDRKIKEDMKVVRSEDELSEARKVPAIKEEQLRLGLK